MKKKPFPLFVDYIFLLLANILTAFVYNLGNEIWLLMPMRLGALVINVAGVTLIAVLVLHCIHKFLKVNLFPLVMGVAWILLFIESFLLLNFRTLITPSTILVMLETNRQEASEFFASYFNLTTWLVMSAVLGVSVVVLCGYQKLRTMRFPQWWQYKNVLFSVCLLTLVVYAGLVYYITQVRKMTSYQALTGVERLYHSFQSTLRDRKDYKAYLRLMKKELPMLTRKEAGIPYIVVILGESLSKWHMSLYGYRLETNPRLTERWKKGELIRYDSVSTPYAATLRAIQEITTFYDKSSEFPWYRYHTVASIMRAAGYKTYWLSNQESFDYGEGNIIAGIASTSSVVEFSHSRHASEERYGYFDGELLPLLEKHLHADAGKAFFCFHLMGSHWRYTNRYPAEFSHFQIEDINKEVGREKKRTIAEYDNSVFYNDFVCDRIMESFREKDALVFCFPDHGEEVYDTRDVCGHCLDNPSRPMQEIPFMIWTSDVFREKRPELVAAMKSAEKKAFDTTNLIHTIMDICGLESEDYRPENSLLYTFE